MHSINTSPRSPTRPAPALSPALALLRAVKPGKALLAFRTAKARAYMGSLTEKGDLVAVRGTLGEYGKAVLANLATIDAGDTNSAGCAKIRIWAEQGTTPGKLKFSAFRLDPARPDLTADLVKKLARQNDVEFNLASHWSEAPASGIWIRAARLETSLDGLQQEAYVLMRPKPVVPGW